MKVSVFIILSIFFYVPILAQEAIPAAGGDATGSDGSVSYSIGQIIYSINTGTNGSVAEGVQQPYEISVVTGFEYGDINIICSVYPNPVIDFLTLDVEFSELGNLYYQLYDINGKQLVSKKPTSNRTYIEMAKLAPATYFLKVTDHQKVVKVFKIIKNQ